MEEGSGSVWADEGGIVLGEGVEELWWTVGLLWPLEVLCGPPMRFDSSRKPRRDSSTSGMT